MKYSVNKLVNRSGHELLMSATDIDFVNRTITVTGEIDDELASLTGSALRALARDSDEDITVYIMSPGGSVTAGFAIYDTVKSLGCDVVTVATGMVASMAAFLFAAAGTRGKRYIQPNAEILIHQPLGGVQGQASDIKIHAEHILKTRETLNRILAENTGKPIEVIAADTERDNFMSAEAAKEYGLVDRVIVHHA